MKIVAIIVALVVLIGLWLLACPSGSTDWEGGCAALPSAEESTVAPAAGIVSDEKPSHHPEPAYQRGDVIAVTPPSLAKQDAKDDLKKIKATIQGKKEAHVPLTDEEKAIDQQK